MKNDNTIWGVLKIQCLNILNWEFWLKRFLLNTVTKHVYFFSPQFSTLSMRLSTNFFYAFAFCVSKRWDPCCSSNVFSGMVATFSLDATTLSLMQQLFYWNGIAQWVPCTVHGTHKSLYLVTFSLKIGLMVLFTHLKFILL